MSKSKLAVISIVACLSLISMNAPAASAADHAPKAISDPIEPVNRFIFGFNDILDRILFEPLAKGYNHLPQGVKNSVQNFMRNLDTPVIIANNLLQGKLGDAGVATARFFINSTIGVAGLVDVASTQGLEFKDEDFGQTLATWGIGSGPYLVLPILGPSSLRDGTGMLVDTYADPVRIVSDNTDNMWIYYTREAIDGLDTRSRLIKAVEDMRRNSLDYYAAARSAYTQKRDALIRDEQTDGTTPAPGLNSADHP